MLLLRKRDHVNRRRFLQATASAGMVVCAGCAERTVPTAPVSPSRGGDETERDSCANDTPTPEGPQSPYDSLTLHGMPGYVRAYSDSVIVRYRDLGSAARNAVQQALASDGAYRQCISGDERTDVMALFSHIEDRWSRTGGESYDHTYLRYEGEYYGITLVQEGDFVRLDSIPYSTEERPATPTPPS